MPEMMGVSKSMSEMWVTEGPGEERALWMLKMEIIGHGVAGAEPSPQQDIMFNRKRSW